MNNRPFIVLVAFALAGGIGMTVLLVDVQRRYDVAHNERARIEGSLRLMDTLRQEVTAARTEAAKWKAQFEQRDGEIRRVEALGQYDFRYLLQQCVAGVR